MIEKGLPPEEYIVKISKHLKDVMEYGSSTEMHENGVTVIGQDDIIAMVETLKKMGYDWLGNQIVHINEALPAFAEVNTILARGRQGHNPPQA